MTIAQFSFRLDQDKIMHTAIVYRFMDWLAAVGGIQFILPKLVTFVVGGYV